MTTFTGTAGNDSLTGAATDDLLDGLTGQDTMAGGLGNDTYVVDDAGDVVIENVGEGTDLVQTTLSAYTLGSNVENLTFTGSSDFTGTGNTLANVINGGAGNDTLSGGSGNDTLVGGNGDNYLDGGAGTDSMSGGSGNDTYVVDSANDYIVTEGLNGGTDLVISSVDILNVSPGGHDNAYTNIENFTLLAGSPATTVYGNGLANVITGNSNANYIDGSLGADTMIGGAGDDTYVVDNAGDVVTEGSGVGSGTDTVIASASHTLEANVENLVLQGIGSINGTGNSLDNVITGNASANLINGSTGNDTMVGGAGSDTYVVDSASDVVTENSNEGTDLVRTSLTSYTLGDNVEQLQFTSGSNSTGVGNALNNTMTGSTGNDSLDGGAGNDNMAGGAGNDTYVVNAIGDVVTEALGAGTDLIQSSVSYTLGANVENLTLTGVAVTNATGNALDNVLTGNAMNNKLDGGAGNDSMSGGLGNDTYVVDSATDSVTENVGEGTDLVISSISYTLGSNLENLTLLSTGKVDGLGVTLDAANSATGNALDNYITGNAAANSLDDGSGGNDTMMGGAGADTYYVNSSGDKIIEAGTDTDQVVSSVSYSLANQGLIENLTLTAGAGAASATGNTMNNIIIGNASANTIDGGTGNDTMIGGGGNDTYVVDSSSDVITEVSGGGADSVNASASYTLGAYVENLTLTGTAGINATGNTLANILTGNSGANLLNGGAGNDTMSGSGGNDTYVLDSASDLVIENLNQGIDLVKIAANYTLTANVEQLQLAGTGDFTATGNALANTLTGNSGNNLLDGQAGADTMQGGSGNDTYIVDNINDKVVEVAAQGTDEVDSTVNYSLVGGFVENLTLLGTGDLTATGNALNNVLTGNSGNNLLTGGAGADTMIGGLGDDTYVVDNVGDVVTENSGEGTDTVQSTITFSLASLPDIENVTLLGTAAINATGNAANNVLTGNSAGNRLDGGTGADTMVGGDGNDTYVVDNVGDVVVEVSSATAGVDTVTSSVSYSIEKWTDYSGASPVVKDNYVENLTLTGSALVGVGNILANVLTGNANDNVLDGKGGNDTMIGGAGNDTYFVDASGDVVRENVGGGTDVVASTASYTLSANVENLTLTGSASINGTGSADDNTIVGNSGANRIDGGVGADAMQGGAGNDTYIVDNVGDVVIENPGEGTDQVSYSITYGAALADNVENLVLIGAGNINGLGNALNNVLTGNAGNNILDGGTGADKMAGGLGDDTYIVDNVGDVVTELNVLNGGHDLVESSVTYSLAGQYVEDMTLTGSANINATGNGLDNVLTGNDGNNIIDGGVGADSMAGGLGNDTYVVDNAGDVVTEGSGAGTDLVQSSVSFTLSANVEDLWLTASGNVNATGNGLDNHLVGNAGNNILDGGAGADTMTGGGGDDIYVVDNSGDTVVEGAGGGNDTVQASATWTIAANVENLVLTGSSTIDGTGNSAANMITGNSADNHIDGAAGNDTIDGAGGNDTLTGGTGNDIFVFSTALNASTNVATITDFTHGGDVIELDHTIFDALTQTGALDVSAFSNSSTETASTRIYQSGADLFYDADGSGSGAAVKFGHFSGTVPALTHSDFTVI